MAPETPGRTRDSEQASYKDARTEERLQECIKLLEGPSDERRWETAFATEEEEIDEQLMVLDRSHDNTILQDLVLINTCTNS